MQNFGWKTLIEETARKT